MSEWISVKDRFPESYEEVLLVVKHYKGSLFVHGFAVYEYGWPSDAYYFEYWIPNVNIEDQGITIKIENTLLKLSQDQVTHWMPLPEPPAK